MAGGAAHRAPRHPGVVPARPGGPGQDQRQQPGLLQRGQQPTHGLHRPGGEEQDDVPGEGRHVHPEPTVRLRPAVHQQGERLLTTRCDKRQKRCCNSGITLFIDSKSI